MLERLSFDRHVPTSRWTEPVPEIVNPLSKLTELPEIAKIVPWQFTESLAVKAATHPHPAGTTERSSTNIGDALVRVTAETLYQIKTGRKNNQSVIAGADGHGTGFDHTSLGEIRESAGSDGEDAFPRR